MSPVDRLLLGRLAGPAKVICLPTAAGREDPARIHYWSTLGVGHFISLGAEAQALPVIDRASANDPRHAAAIVAANLVYLSGGQPDYLYRTLAGTACWDAIMGVLAAGGVVAGCSAGAMIFGARATPFPWHGGFALLPGALILPHYDEIAPQMARLVKAIMAPRRAVIGIDGNTALVCTSAGGSVAGSGGITVWKNGRSARYTPGDAVFW